MYIHTYIHTHVCVCIRILTGVEGTNECLMPRKPFKCVMNVDRGKAEFNNQSSISIRHSNCSRDSSPIDILYVIY